MNLNVILLLLAVQGLVPSCCEGYSGEEVSGEGPWKEEDWSGSSDSSTDEDDNFSGFESGSSSADGGHDDEGPRTFPRISQTYSNKRFVTSGEGEDKGGSQDNDSSGSKSNGDQDQGSTDKTLESNMDLAKIGDAIDVMKKLKKAKSDQEFAKKLRSGPESLGVAFKTFEQLSGLWISVMHRIWRVWKAKGAKVVMHSIVHDLLNKTGGAITQKVGKMLKKKIVVDLNGSGPATTKNEGSTEPEQNHHHATLHNQTVLPVKKLSIDFIKTNYKEANISSSTKTVKDPIEKVKVSFFGRNANSSKAIQKSTINSQPNRVSKKENDTSVVKETSTDKGKQNIKVKGDKAIRAVVTSSEVVPKNKSTNTSANESEHNISNISNHTMEAAENKKNVHDISVGDSGKNVQKDVSSNVTEVTQQVTRHNSNATEEPNRDQRVRDSANSSNTKSLSKVAKLQEETVKQTPVENGEQSTEQFEKSEKDSTIYVGGQNNERSLTQIKNEIQENAKISERTNEAINKTGKRVLETLKINFLKKNRTSNLYQNNSSATQNSDLETRNDVEFPALKTESNSKPDSGNVTVSSKWTAAVNGSDKTESNASDKNILNVTKSDGTAKSINTQPGVQDDKELSSNKRIDKDYRNRTTTLAKNERIIVKLNGKHDKAKENKINVSVNVAPSANDQKTNGANTNKTSLKEDTSPSTLNVKHNTTKESKESAYVNVLPNVNDQKANGADKNNTSLKEGISPSALNGKHATTKEKKRNTYVNVAPNVNDQEADGMDTTKTSLKEDISPSALNEKQKHDRMKENKKSASVNVAPNMNDQEANGADKNKTSLKEGISSSALNENSDTTKKSKKSASVNAIPNVDDQEVNGGDTNKVSRKEETSASALKNKRRTAKTASDVNSAQVKIKNTVVQNKERKVNTTSPSIKSREDGSKNSRISTNVQRDQKHLETLKGSLDESSNTKNGAVDSSNGNKRVAKVKTQVTKNDGTFSGIDSKIPQSENGGSKGVIANTNVTQPVEKVEDKIVTKQTEGGLVSSKATSVDNSSNSSDKEDQKNIETFKTDTSHARIAETSQKLESSHHSQGGTSNADQKRVRHVNEDAKSVQKDTSNSQTLQDKNKTEIDTNVKIVKPTDNHATSSLVKNSTTKVLENHLKATETRHENSLKASGKVQGIVSTGEIMSHKGKSEKGGTHVRDAITRGRVIGRSGDTGSGVTHDPQNDVTDEAGSGVTHAPETSVTHNPGSKSTYTSENVSTVRNIKSTNHQSKRVSDQAHSSPTVVTGSPDKQSSQEKKSSTRITKKPKQTDSSSNTAHTSDARNVHFTKAKNPTKPKDVTQASRRTKEEERPQSTRAKEGHHVANQENTKSNDQPPPDEKESKSSRTEPNPTKEEIKPSKSQQVDVLTSRTPPTSLLTTSNDDNTYSIKQIVQGPKGSSIVYENHDDDDEKVRRLEKKVSKLESEVTVLETAMADLAKRLLAVEQNSEVPKPTMPAMFPPLTKAPESQAQHPVHSHQQTTVYVAKGLGTTPQAPVPQYGPEKIVIPISSLYSGGASRVSIPSTTIHEEVDHHETKVDNHPDIEDQKPADDTRVTLRAGSQSSPSSEAHAVVRPIVNIIVPNNRADLLSEGALCTPRCQNGGRCFDRNICRCPTFFTGDHCERFSLRDLLESPAPRERPYRKIQRIVVSEPPDRQVLDGTLNLDTGSPALEYRDLSQDLEPGKEYVAKQRAVEVASPSNSAEVDTGGRRRQLILEI